MNILNKLERIKQCREDIFNHFGADPDIDKEYPIDDMTNNYWFVYDDRIHWSDDKEYILKHEEGFYVEKFIIMGKDDDYTFVCITNTSGADFISSYGIFDNNKKLEIEE